MPTNGTQTSRWPATLLFFYLASSGIVYGTIRFGEVIARKSLGATEIQVTLLTMLMPLMGFTAIWWGRILTNRDRRPFLVAIIVLFIGGMVVLGVYISSYTHLYFVHFTYYLAIPLLTPATNRILQQHVNAKNHGVMYGWSQGVRMLLAAVISLGGGYYLDQVTDGYRYLYLFAGIVTVLGVLALVFIPNRMPNGNKNSDSFNIVVDPLKETIALLRRRGDFLRFEMAFMLYGFGFMILLPVVPVFLVDDLAMDYATIGLGRGTVMQLVLVGGIPLFGWLYDRATPQIIAAYVFTMLAFQPLLLILSGLSAGSMQLGLFYAAFVFQGFAMAGVFIVWSIASNRFAGDGEDAAVYQSVHVAFTSVRGIFAPLLGYLTMLFFGKYTAMSLSMVFFLAGGMYMFYLQKKDGIHMQLVPSKE